ncbi:MAG: alanine racemase [Lachnospiraceae bacterium]|nr:alanine racemase [Lachnospiraceae bacterium]
MIDEKTLRKIAADYGTPIYIFDEDEVRERAVQIKNILGENTRLCYSIKANPFLIPALMYVVDMFEVCSPGELSICKEYKVPGEKIIYSGVRKETFDIIDAIKYDAAILTAESVRHYELTKEAAKKLNKPVKMILRLSSKSQFGMSAWDIEEIIKKNRDDDIIEIVGIHYFAGTQRTKLSHQTDELKMLKGTIKGLREKYGLSLPVLEYGPGLSYPYFVDDPSRPVKEYSDAECSTDNLEPLKMLLDDLTEITGDHELTVEMGRFIASSCGYYLTKAVDKKRSFGTNWCILDGGINHVNYYGQMMGMKIPEIRILKKETVSEDICTSGNGTDDKGKSDNTKWTLCGSLCTTNDVLVRDIVMDEPSIGDILVMCNIGAYSVTESLYLFLSHPMPRVVMKKDDTYTLVRNFVDTWELNSAAEIPFI